MGAWCPPPGFPPPHTQWVFPGPTHKYPDQLGEVYMFEIPILDEMARTMGTEKPSDTVTVIFELRVCGNDSLPFHDRCPHPGYAAPAACGPGPTISVSFGVPRLGPPLYYGTRVSPLELFADFCCPPPPNPFFTVSLLGLFSAAPDLSQRLRFFYLLISPLLR